MVDQIKEKHEVEVTWLPFFLHPEIPEQGTRLSPARRAQFDPMWERLKQRAEQAEIEVVRPDHVPNTRRALEASEYARAQGRHEEFHRIVFDKYYAQGEDIHDWAVLREAAQAAGLDPDEMQQKTERGAYQDMVQGHYERAHSLGITGIPTYILNDQYAIVGAQPLEAFEAAIQRLRQTGGRALG